MANSWEMISYTKNGINHLQDCEKDDTFDFNTNNVLILNRGTVCNKDETNSITYIYALSDDQKTLTFDGNAWIITSITDSKMVLSQNSDIITYKNK